jgi:hypothetical protein
MAWVIAQLSDNTIETDESDDVQIVVVDWDVIDGEGVFELREKLDAIQDAIKGLEELPPSFRRDDLLNTLRQREKEELYELDEHNCIFCGESVWDEAETPEGPAHEECLQERTSE